MGVQDGLFNNSVDYAVRMVRDGFATAEQAAAICGIAVAGVEQALKTGGGTNAARRPDSAERLAAMLGWER